MKYFKITFLFLLSLPLMACDETDVAEAKVGFVSSGITSLVVTEMKKRYAGQCDNDCGLTFVGFPNPPALNNALVFGEIDIAVATSASAVALAREQGHDVKYLFPNVLNSVSVIVPRDSDIRTLSDFSDETIGWYGLPTSGGIGLLLVMEETAPSALKTLEIRQAGAPLLPTLLADGELDAIVIFEPFASALVGSGDYKRIGKPFYQQWIESRGYPLELSGTAAATEWINENASTIQFIQGLWGDSVRSIIGEPASTISENMELLGFTKPTQVDLLATELPSILVTDWGDARRGIDDMIGHLLSAGLVSESSSSNMFYELDGIND